MSAIVNVLSTFANITVIVVTFLVMFSLLVAAHELGHYLFARLFGMGCEEFAIGFGKKPLVVYGRRRYFIPLKPDDDPDLGLDGGFPSAEGFASSLEGGSRKREVEVVDSPEGRRLYESTEFTIRPIPLGGFVRIKGMVPSEDGSEVKIPGGFYSFAPWKRLIVLFAGPLFSILAGVALLIPLFMLVGQPRQNTFVAAIIKDSPAEKVGLLKGDRVLSVDGVKTTSFFDVVENVWSKAGKPITLLVDRQGKAMTFVAVPNLSPEEVEVLDRDGIPTGEKRRPAQLGLVPDRSLVRLNFNTSVSEAFRAPIKMAQSLGSMVSKPKKAESNLSGPVGIVATTKLAVESGPATVVELAAMLSISLGIFNLLPVYPLDGGQMMVAFAEMLRGGRRISLAVQSAFGTVGLALILMLLMTATFFDFSRMTKSKNEKPPVIAPSKK